MTDFTDSIETTAASVEDLQQDLESHLEDILDIEVDLRKPAIVTDDGVRRLSVRVDLPGLEDELESRFEGITPRFSAKIPDSYLEIELDSDPE